MSEQNNKDPKLTREEWLKSDSLSEAERKALEERFVEEDFESKALKGRTFLDSEQDAADLLAELDSAITNQYDSKVETATVSSKVMPIRRWLSYAAAVLLLLTAAWWLWPKSINGENLYASYYAPYPNELTITSMGSNAPESSILEIMRPYNAGRYSEAAEKIGNYLSDHPTESALQLYYGISLLENQRSDAAIEALKKAKQYPDFSETANWYLALAYVRGNRVEEAKPILKKLTISNSSFKENAKQLLQAL